MTGQPTVGQSPYHSGHTGGEKLAFLGSHIGRSIKIYYCSQGQRREKVAFGFSLTAFPAVFFRSRIRRHDSQIRPGRLPPQSYAASVITVLITMLPQKAESGLHILQCSRIRRFTGQAVVDGGAGISFFSKVAVKELYLMRLRIIDHKTAAMDEHQQWDGLDRRWNIQIEPLGGSPPGIRQMPICIAATPLVHLYMSDWCRQIIPDYVLHTQYRGDMPFLIHSVGLLY